LNHDQKSCLDLSAPDDVVRSRVFSWLGALWYSDVVQPEQDTYGRAEPNAHKAVDRLQGLLLKNQDANEVDRYQNFSDFAHATGNGLAEVLRPDGRRAYPSPSAAVVVFPWPTVKMADSDDSFTSFTSTVAEVALRNHHLDARSRKAFEDIADEASKASVLLDDMLTLARADSGSFNGILEPVDLAMVVEEACEMSRARWPMHEGFF